MKWYGIFREHKVFFNCIFFHYHLSPLYPSPCNHHPVVHVHESFFLFVQSLHSLTSLLPNWLTSCSPSMSLSIFSSSVCSLDSTYEWSHRVFVFLWLAFSLSIMFSRSIHMLQRVKFSSLLRPGSSCFIHSSTDGHSGCLQILVIVNNVAHNLLN